MFEDPEETPEEHAVKPADRAREKADEFRMHAELAAVFEAVRKFDAQVRPDLEPAIAREVQRTMGRLEKSKSAEHPVLPPESAADAAALLALPETRALSTNDYHVHRRPGEVMILRWLAGDGDGAGDEGEVQTYYQRLQAHFDAAMDGYREEERHSQQWKGDPQTLAYLDALDKLEVRMDERYLREPIRQHGLFVLSTQSADEVNIAYLCDYIMGVPASEVVGARSAPPEDQPTERDLAWFFKLFSLRGVVEGTERMCFFTFLQKSDEDLDA